MKTRRITWMLAGCSGLFGMMLSGCGDSEPVRKGAAKELTHAKDLADAGDLAASRKDYVGAMADYKNAIAAIEEGRPNANDSEESTLKLLATSVRKKMADAEMNSITDKPVEKTPVANQIQKEDEADKKKKEKEKADAELAAKKEAEKQKAIDKAMSQKDTAANSKKADDAPAPGGGTDAATNEKKKDGADDAAATDDKKVPDGQIEPAKPPFPAVTDKSPAIDIIKLGHSGRFVWAYVQIYNKDENGHRINMVNAFFKDGDRQTMIDHGTAAFPFAGFRENAKDMIGDQGADALTLGSDAVDGHGFKRYVIVGEHDRAKDVKLVTVKVAYDGGDSPYAEGPNH